MAIEENGFLEFLQLQGGDPTLVTKSELISQVRGLGYSLTDRQLTFYMAEGLVPRSVRVGSRAGAYPEIVVDLLVFILWARDGGVPIESMRELLPVWKMLIRARRARTLDMNELEYVARQHLNSMEAVMAVPQMVGFVLQQGLCASCQANCNSDFTIAYKDGSTKSMNDAEATVGFAIARHIQDADGHPEGPRWVAQTRLSLATTADPAVDQTTVILGIKPNDPLPAYGWGGPMQHSREAAECPENEEVS